MAYAQHDVQKQTGPDQQVMLDSFREHMIPNFGARCTLVSVAAVLHYYGASALASQLAIAIEKITGFREGYGPPNLAYLSLGNRPLVDRAIEQVAREQGLDIHSRTRLLVTTGQIVRALDARQPVILNMLRAPSGTWSHSVVAYGYRWSPRLQLLIRDPNDLKDYWFFHHLGQHYAVTATFIAPKGPREGWLTS